MAYIDPHGVRYSDDQTVLVKCPTDFAGEYIVPAGVTGIGHESFLGCNALTSVTLPDGVEWIGRNAFQDCTGLMSITLPASVKKIDLYAFNGCNGLTSIAVDAANPTYDSRCRSNAIIETGTNTLIVGCKNTTIPDGVTAIEEYAFKGCTGLTSITIPDGVKTIGWNAFQDCTGLASIVIPSSVRNFGDCAFYGCSALKKARVPKGCSFSRDAFPDTCRIVRY